MTRTRFIIWLVAPVVLGTAAFLFRSGTAQRQFAIWTNSEPVADFPSEVKLGDCEIGETAVARLAIGNRGGGELHIDDIRNITCACTSLDYEQDGRFSRVDSIQLKRGETAKVAIRVNVQGPHGRSMRNAVVFRTNDPTRREGRIDVLIPRVKGGVTSIPTSVLFNTLPVGVEHKQIIEIRDEAVPPRKLERVVSSDSERVSARLMPVPPRSSPNVDNNGELIGLVEVVVRSAEAGPVAAQLQLYLDGEGRPPDTIAVSGRVSLPVEAIPSKLVLPRYSGDGPLYRAVCLCRSVSGAALDLQVDEKPSGLFVRIDAVPKNLATRLVHIEWNSTADSDSEDSSIRRVRLLAMVAGLTSHVEIPVTCRRGEQP